MGELCGVYYEQQERQHCALHSVNCVLHSVDKSPTKPGFMTYMDGRSAAECATTGWNDNAIRSVLRENFLSFDDVTQYHDGVKPNATAWIINHAHHWHAYVKNKAGTWFDVESYKGGRPTENWCPVYVGDDEAMMKRLREVERPKGSRIYRVQQESPMQNGGFGQLDQGGFFEAPKPEGGWSCEMCSAKNKSTATACSACTYIPKKTDKAVEGQWKCKTCDEKNDPTAMKCSKCPCWNPIMLSMGGW